MKVKLFACSLLAFLALASPVFAAPSDNALNHIPVCLPGNDGTARCHARVVTDQKGHPQATTSPTGYSALQFQTAYGLTNTTSGGRTLAIVDAYGDPTIENDLHVYSTQFTLPDCAISTGCLKVVNQSGNAFPLPGTSSSWALETSLDVEVAHAVCPDCKLLLVEANDSSYTNLMAAVDRARMMGASTISNSYGSNEFFSESVYDSHFNWPGVAFTFSSGDSGYGVEYPAASRYVTAVGGTTLNLNGNNYLSETAWSGAGSGCSSYESQPFWQSLLSLGSCTHRIVADVSADADPNTGASVYDTTAYSGQTGWWQVGGTSLASPIVAGVYALSGNTGTNTVSANSLPYMNTSFLHDITTGRNGFCRKSSYLCTAKVGYDGPTGLGSPNGINAF